MYVIAQKRENKGVKGPRNDLLGRGALPWILVRHRINQSLYKRETGVDLKCQMSHKPTNIYVAFTNEVPKVIYICVERIAQSGARARSYRRHVVVLPVRF